MIRFQDKVGSGQRLSYLWNETSCVLKYFIQGSVEPIAVDLLSSQHLKERPGVPTGTSNLVASFFCLRFALFAIGGDKDDDLLKIEVIVGK
jgi:hypothetical protein